MPSQINIFDELIIDNFAGGGGASTGIELATGRPVDIAINHDLSAIAMHKANHPHTRHFCESVWKVDPRKATKGQPVALAWFSPDCTHHSKARGGKPVKKEIRGLAWVAVRWAATVRPRVIILENVEEFKTWGPVRDGQPVKSQTGRTFNSFVNALRRHGYAVDWRELRACDYGAPTIRKRLFLIARCDGQPIVFPEPTHGSPGSDGVKSGRLKPWRTAAEIIDWTLPCPSIFDTSAEIWRKHGLRAVRPLAEATLRRIARGMQKFVIDNPEPYILPWTVCNTTNATGALIDEPLGTVRASPAGGGQWLILPTLIQTGYGEAPGQQPRTPGLDKPLGTVVSTTKHAFVTAFMSKYYAGGHNGSGNSLAEPLNTVTTIDHNALVTSHLTIFRNNSDGQDHREPFNTVMTSPGHFGEVRAFLIKYHGEQSEREVRGQPLDEPLRVVDTSGRHGLVTVHGEQYAITDIGLRMLTPRELFNAQGFPPDYIIDVGEKGESIRKSDQVARCGNAVPPPFSEALVRANLPELCGGKIGSMAQLREEMGA
jgi:DNA (cytosine-5)-methyltransferase 1